MIPTDMSNHDTTGQITHSLDLESQTSHPDSKSRVWVITSKRICTAGAVILLITILGYGTFVTKQRRRLVSFEQGERVECRMTDGKKGDQEIGWVNARIMEKTGERYKVQILQHPNGQGIKDENIVAEDVEEEELRKPHQRYSPGDAVFVFSVTRGTKFYLGVVDEVLKETKNHPRNGDTLPIGTFKVSFKADDKVCVSWIEPDEIWFRLRPIVFCGRKRTAPTTVDVESVVIEFQKQDVSEQVKQMEGEIDRLAKLHCPKENDIKKLNEEIQDLLSTAWKWRNSTQKAYSRANITIRAPCFISLPKDFYARGYYLASHLVTNFICKEGTFTIQLRKRVMGQDSYCTEFTLDSTFVQE